MTVALDTNAYSDLMRAHLLLCTADRHFRRIPQLVVC